MKYRSDIDGLRAVAVLSVIGFHAFPMAISGGYVGVDIFFMISGFLITRILLDGLGNKNFTLNNFYGNRILRIFPSLIIVLITVLLIGWMTLLANEYELLGKHIAAGATFISNYVLLGEVNYFDSAAEKKPLLHLWSLGIEEQFYIAWPILLWYSLKRGFNALLVALLLAISSFLYSLYVINFDKSLAFYSPFSRIWELSVGSLLACLFASKNSRNSLVFNTIRNRWLLNEKFPNVNSSIYIINNILSLSGLFLIVFSVIKFTEKTVFPSFSALFPVFGTALIVSAGRDAWFNRIILSNPILVFLGLISFPLYLWHWPILSFIYIFMGPYPSIWVKVSALMLSFTLAWITYLYIERPFRLNKTKRTQKIYFLSILLLSVGTLGFYIWTNNGLPFRDVVVKNIDPNKSSHYQRNNEAPCFTDSSYMSIGPFCKKYPASSSVKTIAIWGDSSSAAWLPVFLDVAKQNNYTIVSISQPSCPPIVGARKTQLKYREAKSYCSDGENQAEVISFFKKLNPDLIILIASWNAYSSSYAAQEFLTDNNVDFANPETTLRVLKNGVPETLEILSNISNLIVFKSWPNLDAFPNYEIDRLPFKVSNSFQINVDIDKFRHESLEINSIFDEIKNPRISFFDPSTRVCDVRRCYSMLEGTQIYSDIYHITAQGAMLFRSDVLKLLQVKN